MSIWRRSWFLWSAEILIFVICCLAAWRLVEDRVTGNKTYIAMPEDFVVTPAPQWIRADIKRQVLQNASLDSGVSILDEDLVQRVADAFPLHPWVEGVTRVHKQHPARVTVELTYRQPVAMVVVPGGLYAVDSHGVLLPSEDFVSEEAARYPRVSGMRVPPQGQVGDAWGDGQVEAACRLAAILQEQWNGWGLARIEPSPTQATGDPRFDLITRSGARISWGNAPTADALRASKTDVRLELLSQFARQHGSLDAQGAEQLDLSAAKASARQAMSGNSGQRLQ
ncbi:MAG: hypothetical protein MPJ50_14045 [Pirellulales bacterium]|nr:hypothetical protein [Pirellulales bacterium]